MKYKNDFWSELFCRIAAFISNCRWDLPGFSKEIQTWKKVTFRLIGCGIKVNPDSLLKKKVKNRTKTKQKNTTKQMKNPDHKQQQTPTPKKKKKKKIPPQQAKIGKTKHPKQNQWTKTLKPKPLHIFTCSSWPVEN